MKYLVSMICGCFILWCTIMAISAFIRAGDTEAIALEVFEEINQYRVAENLSSLKWDETLASLAIRHSQYMSDTGNYIHSGFPGENILEGFDAFPSGHSIVSVWRSSPLHYANMMKESIKKGAVGVIGNYATFMAK